MAAACSTSWSHTKRTRFIGLSLLEAVYECGYLFDHAKHLFVGARQAVLAAWP